MCYPTSSHRIRGGDAQLRRTYASSRARTTVGPGRAVRRTGKRACSLLIRCGRPTDAMTVTDAGRSHRGTLPFGHGDSNQVLGNDDVAVEHCGGFVMKACRLAVALREVSEYQPAYPG